MASIKSTFSRRLWTVRQALFPSFERKPYHLQFRHGALITMMLMCASFTLPSFHQLPPFPLSDFSGSADIPVEASYNLIHRYVNGIMYYNSVVACFMALHLMFEPFFRRTAPVWYELTWMTLITIGEAVCLGLMASSRPPVCDFHFPMDKTIPTNGKFTPMNSATSICSNWGGMTGLLAAIICVFLLHVLWHVVVSVRHLSRRRSVFMHPITDYRWNLPEPLERINDTFPGDVEAAEPERKESKDLESTQYTSADYTFKSTNTDTLSFPITPTSHEFSNYSRPSESPVSKAQLHTLPIAAQPVVLEQSTVTRSDTSSIVESDNASSTHAPNKYAPFAYESRI